MDTSEIINSIERIEATIDMLWRTVSLDAHILWETKDVAAYFRVGEAQVHKRADCIASFPAAIRNEDDKARQAHPRYAPEEIKTWASSPAYRVSEAI